jgi:addiction module HigA family antidote
VAEYAAKRNPNRCPTHPGELLREEVIPATGKTKTEIAALLGISRQHLYDILEERKPVSPAVAVRLASFLVMAPASGAACSVPMIPGGPNATLLTRSRKYRR